MVEKKSVKTRIYVAKNGYTVGRTTNIDSVLLDNGWTLEHFEVNMRETIQCYQDNTGDKLEWITDVIKFEHEQVSFDELMEDIKQLAKNAPHWRYGQAIFNYLHLLYPGATDKIRGTEFDCFHKESEEDVDKFIAEIKKRCDV